MVIFVIAGTAITSAWGKMIRVYLRHEGMFSVVQASYWPLGTACTAPRTISAP